MLSRGLCTFAQSAIAILIALYLEKLGFNLTQAGAFLSAGVTGTAFRDILNDWVCPVCGVAKDQFVKLD